MSEVQRPLRGRGRRGEREGGRRLLLLGAPPLPLEAATAGSAAAAALGLHPEVLPRLGSLARAGAVVGGEFEHEVGRGDGGQVGTVPDGAENTN